VLAVLLVRSIGIPSAVEGGSRTLGLELDEEVAEDFSSIAKAMFTAFRCLMGDCETQFGQPLVKLLALAYGFWFQIGYMASTLFVTFGLFNLIMAIYIENTMSVAKEEEEKSRGKRERESIRVAHLTKKLLLRFYSAHRTYEQYQVLGDADQVSVKELLSTKVKSFDVDDTAEISKELFYIVLQDHEVQRLMDQLDIPPDRAHLFDILDADGSGGLHVTELVQGLLSIRGQVRKSDTTASLLAVRSLQTHFRQFERASHEHQHCVLQYLERMAGTIRTNNSCLF